MSEQLPLPNRYLRTHEAGHFLGLSGRTLEKHRVYGTGPTFRKIGGRVVYAIEDLQAWADKGKQQATSDVRGTHPARRPAEPRTFSYHRRRGPGQATRAARRE
jgi:predicted DNA-binding transcriptional regulator AlpA